MLETLAMAVLKAIVSFIFQEAMVSGTDLDIEGAPRWYGRSERGQFCVSTYHEGGLDAVDRVKEKVYVKLTREIERAIDMALVENFQDLKDEKEKKFISLVAKDEKLPLFIERYAQLKNLEYDEDRQIAFARACISKERFEAYQHRRIEHIRKSLSLKRSEDAFQELEMVK